METRKDNILRALRAFVRQRPGLEFCNYGDVKAYRAELRVITRSLHHAEKMLNSVAWRDSITADSIIEASKRAFSGRLSITESKDKPDHVTINYCTGQYWPTEYRSAVCSVLSSVLWGYWRENLSCVEGEKTWQPGIVDMSNAIRKTARDELGRSIASTWFR
jgi:hypothetical protein